MIYLIPLIFLAGCTYTQTYPSCIGGKPMEIETHEPVDGGCHIDGNLLGVETEIIK